MRPDLVRLVAAILVAVLAFAQTAVASANCLMDRAAFDQAMVMGSADLPCDGCDSAANSPEGSQNLCAVHCTSDLQIAGFAHVAVLGAQDLSVIAFVSHEHSALIVTRATDPPCVGPPHRVMLHSFLI
ncbi:MAG: hypothetical protein ABR570_16580 [Burkholderiales bacterium]